MKNPKKAFHALHLLLAVLLNSTATAAVIVPFQVSYFTTNYPASDAAPATPDMASGVWLGNLRGNATWRDLLIANKANNSVSIRLCNDNGTFGALTNYSVDANPVGVRTADLNNDLYEDIITANSGTNTVSVLLNAAGTNFISATNYVVGSTATPEPTALATGDLTGDGAMDIVVANAGEDTVSLLLNDGFGAFNLWVNYAVGSRPTSVGLADVNNDGQKDIYTANKTAGTLTFLLKAFDATYSTNQTITLFPGGDPQPVQAQAADLNADGLVDIVTANYNSNTVSVLMGPGFAVTTNYSVGSAPVGVVVRDLNRDSLPDIAVVNSAGASVSVLLNSGNGTFVAGPTKPVGSNPTAIAGSNFDNGSLTDLAVANNGDNTVSILLYDMPLSEPQSFSALEDQPKSITLHGTTLAGRTRNYTITVQPTNGTLTGTAPNLTYTPTPGVFGPDSFRYVFNDGFNTSEEALVSIDVAAVNDAPSFIAATNRIEVTQFGIVVTQTNFAGALDRGAANESAQKLTFAIVVTNTAFFTVRPVIGTNLALSFKPSLNAVGTNVIFVRVVDDGGTANGGIDGSAAVPVEIVVPTNPFKTFSGRYNGLFYETNAVANDSSGFFNLSVTSAGLASGRILLNKAYGFRTHFLADGTTQFTVSRGTNGSPLSVALQLDSSNQQIQGTVSDGVWTAELLCDRATFNAMTNPAPQAGIYTMLLDGSTNGAVSPAGQSYGIVKVNAAGKISLVGKLADGTAISQTATLSQDGTWPLYISRYSGKGSVLSWINFTNTATEDFVGNVSWIKTPGASGTRYTAGFTNDSVVIGSVYTVPDSTTRVLLLNNAVSVLEGGGLATPLTNQVVLEANNVFTVTGGTAKQFGLTVNVVNGFLYGRFLHPTTKLITPISGVIFQRRNMAGGYFLGPIEGGKFSLSTP